MSPILFELDGKENEIHELLASMHLAVNEAIEAALVSLQGPDSDLAYRVIGRDEVINQLHEQVEEVCFTTIARHQPVAQDLRDLISDTHIARELERIGDLAVSIARIVIKLEKPIPEQILAPILELGDQCQQMLNGMMRAYHEADAELVREVAARDDLVDESEARIIENLLESISLEADNSRLNSYLIWIAHGFERMGDRITNIGERILFVLEGEITDLN